MVLNLHGHITEEHGMVVTDGIWTLPGETADQAIAARDNRRERLVVKYGR